MIGLSNSISFQTISDQNCSNVCLKDTHVVHHDLSCKIEINPMVLTLKNIFQKGCDRGWSQVQNDILQGVKKESCICSNNSLAILKSWWKHYKSRFTIMAKGLGFVCSCTLTLLLAMTVLKFQISYGVFYFFTSINEKKK